MKFGIVLMAYGTPSNEEEILPYYTDIRHGRPPSEEQLRELVRRYRAIGASPLAAISKNQAAAVKKALSERFPQDHFDVVNGYLHIAPKVEDAVRGLVEKKVDRIIGLVLSPQYGRKSSEPYHRNARKELERLGAEVPYEDVRDWFRQPPIIQYWAEQLSRSVAALPDENYRVLFSAHNVPVRPGEETDEYGDQVLQMAGFIADAAGIAREKWLTAWQGGHAEGIRWMEPDLEETAKTLVRSGVSHIISAPIGFISDNLEILYDLDIELRVELEAMGGILHRLGMPNTDPLVVNAIADALAEKIRSYSTFSPGTNKRG
jgi:ferrochelatase